MNDLELLRRYSESGSQEAFSSLVARHIDLVYSAARRQVGSPDQAQEVAQAVFLELVASEKKLREDTHLASWLYVATRRRAVDLVRREASRQRREQAAAEIADMKTSADSQWSELASWVDEAVGSLDELDRKAVLLRFFENRSLSEVGRALGSSDDAAQKRVTRALDRLRYFFAKRGVTTTAAALATELSAHAVEVAPVGAVSAIAAAASVGATGAGMVGETTRTFLNASVQKTMAAVAVSGLLGVLVYQSFALRKQAELISSLSVSAAKLSAEVRAVRLQRDDAQRRTSGVSPRATRVELGDPEFDERIRALVARIAAGKKWLEVRADQKIPELRYLTERDWIDVMQKHSRLETDEDFRWALSAVRMRAAGKFAEQLQTALKAYVKAEGGRLPDEVRQLAPYFESPVEEALLAKYEMKATGRAEALEKYRSDVVVGKLSTIVDPSYDGRQEIGLEQLGELANPLHSKEIFINTDEELLRFERDSETARFLINPKAEALRRFRAVHHGEYPTTARDLAPYFQNLSHVARYLEWSQGPLGKTERY